MALCQLPMLTHNAIASDTAKAANSRASHLPREPKKDATGAFPNKTHINVKSAAKLDMRGSEGAGSRGGKKCSDPIFDRACQQRRTSATLVLIK
jgi:hypothetical protein